MATHLGFEHEEPEVTEEQARDRPIPAPAGGHYPVATLGCESTHFPQPLRLRSLCDLLVDQLLCSTFTPRFVPTKHAEKSTVAARRVAKRCLIPGVKTPGYHQKLAMRGTY